MQYGRRQECSTAAWEGQQAPIPLFHPPLILAFTPSVAALLTGNFYHLKDRDADIGMRVGLQAMGGSRGKRTASASNVDCHKHWYTCVRGMGYGQQLGIAHR